MIENMINLLTILLLIKKISCTTVPSLPYAVLYKRKLEVLSCPLKKKNRLEI